MAYNLSRRDFLRMTALTAAGAAAAGCVVPTPVPTSAPAEAPAPTTAPPPEPVTLKYWRHFTDSGDKVTKQMVENFKQVAPEITVEYEAVPDGEYEQRLTVAAAAGEEFMVGRQ